ncbi:MAG: hypothetical protein FWG10_00840 [Eubacteriaceae bacterium]|nr:hypothetical protein [Eubacteriaceae bacterium]
MDNNIYSYHTFLYPFIWKTDGDMALEEFANNLSSQHWHEISFGDPGVFPNNRQSDYIPSYNAYQSFTESGRELVFGSGKKQAMRNYEFRLNGNKWKSIDNNGNATESFGKYHITKGSETFKLTINSIKLNIYGSGGAILSIELENTEHKTHEAANKINEYGRYVFFPYIKSNNGKCLAQTPNPLADKIEIWLNEEISSSGGLRKKVKTEINAVNFLSIANRLAWDFETGRSEMQQGSQARLLESLLGMDSTLPFTSQLGYSLQERQFSTARQSFYIEPAITGKMFTCCLVVDPELVADFKGANGNDLSYPDFACIAPQAANDIFSSVYKLLAIEPLSEGQSRKMHQNLLERCIWDFWSDYGTILGVSQDAMVCVAGSANRDDDVATCAINPFLFVYVNLVKIALAQYASMAAFGKLAGSLVDEDPKKTPEYANRLRKEFAAAHRQLFLFDPTNNQKGLQLFEMLQRELGTLKHRRELDRQLEIAWGITPGIKRPKNQSWLATLLLALIALANFGTFANWLTALIKWVSGLF